MSQPLPTEFVPHGLTCEADENAPDGSGVICCGKPVVGFVRQRGVCADHWRYFWGDVQPAAPVRLQEPEPLGMSENIIVTKRPQEPAAPLDLKQEFMLRDLKTRIVYANGGMLALADSALYWRKRAEDAEAEVSRLRAAPPQDWNQDLDGLSKYHFADADAFGPTLNGYFKVDEVRACLAGAAPPPPTPQPEKR